MNINRRALVALILASAGVSAIAAEPPWPTKPVRLIVGFAPGGGTDIVARLIAQKLTETLGQSFVVDNRPGATGMIGAKTVATSPADGYTLLFGHVNSQAIAPAISERPQYDPDKDFASVAYIGFVANVLVINANSPDKSVADLVARAKASPQGLVFASPGIGSTNHLAGEMLRLQTGAKLVHVPYKGSGPAAVDLMAGLVDMNFDVTASVMPYLKSGRVRALAVTSKERDPQLPDVPTLRELGYKSFDITNWYGVEAPAGTPTAIVNFLNERIEHVLAMPDVVARFAELGVGRIPMTPAQFAEFNRAESAKYRDFAKQSGVRFE
ncbi:tripartite tricarboxylate transporter substrate binding protein [soil metagenome]